MSNRRHRGPVIRTRVLTYVAAADTGQRKPERDDRHRGENMSALMAGAEVGDHRDRCRGGRRPSDLIFAKRLVTVLPRRDAAATSIAMIADFRTGINGSMFSPR